MTAMQGRALVIALAVMSAGCRDRESSTTATTARKIAIEETTAPGARSAICTAKDLNISLGRTGAALGHWGTRVMFRNIGTANCELTGYPEVAGLDNDGRHADPAAHTPFGYIGWDTSEPPQVVDLAPGDVASAVIEGSNVPEGDATCGTYKALRIAAPGETQSVDFDGSWNNCSGIEVHPVTAGAAEPNS